MQLRKYEIKIISQQNCSTKVKSHINAEKKDYTLNIKQQTWHINMKHIKFYKMINSEVLVMVAKITYTCRLQHPLAYASCNSGSCPKNDQVSVDHSPWLSLEPNNLTKKKRNKRKLNDTSLIDSTIEEKKKISLP